MEVKEGKEVKGESRTAEAVAMVAIFGVGVWLRDLSIRPGQRKLVSDKIMWLMAKYEDIEDTKIPIHQYINILIYVTRLFMRIDGSLMSGNEKACEGLGRPEKA